MRHRIDRQPARTRTSVLGRVGDALLAVVGVAGALTLVAFIAAQCLSLSLVTFATGSMAPAYPAGAVAVAQLVPLPSIRVGDVVTVDRTGGMLPITHRVIGITRSATADEAVVRLQGDANADPDPQPYVVHELHRVLWGLPVPAALSRLLGSPLAAGLLVFTIGGAALRGFWPGQRRPRHLAARASTAA